MLHIVTPLFRYQNLPYIYSSIPSSKDIVWHIAKTRKRERLNFDFIKKDKRIKVYEINCEDNDMITKRNTMFDNIKSGHFHLLDDDTIFHPTMYDTYLKYKDYVGMIIGKQLFQNMTIRLLESYPAHSCIDSGNVLCHSSILRKVKWQERAGYEKFGCRDFIFWDNCMKSFGADKVTLIPEAISIYNNLQ